MLNTLAIRSRNGILEAKRFFAEIRKVYNKKTILLSIGLLIGVQALMEWVINHRLLASCIGAGLTAWAWTEVNFRLREAEKKNDGSDMLWGFLFMFTLAAMIGMPIAVASSAPPSLHDWLLSAATHIKGWSH